MIINQDDEVLQKNLVLQSSMQEFKQAGAEASLRVANKARRAGGIKVPASK
jgi:hypothetical protein